jgi:hypothetical protein
MIGYVGKYDYLDNRGAIMNDGPCQIGVDGETCILQPSQGAPMVFDLGNVDRVAPGEWELSLILFTGRTVRLRQFGAAFGRLTEAILTAWRDRTIQCLLLEDLAEVARFDATVARSGGVASPAGIRLYGSNLAVLPQAGSPFQWRLAEVESVHFDSSTYNVTIQSGPEMLVVSKLAKKTEEFRGLLGATLDSLHSHAGDALHRTFPFLDPDQLQVLVNAMPEGRSVPLSGLAAIHPELPGALVARGVDAHIKPYFDELRARSSGELMAGFKFVRPDEEKDEEKDEEAGEEAPAVAAGSDQEQLPLFFWFFFQVAPDVLAWESTTGNGRATYFFRIPPGHGAAAAVAAFTHGLSLVNFRREPVYLPDAALQQQARYHRYSIAARKLPDLRALRAALMGRAIHISPEKWAAQMQTILGK